MNLKDIALAETDIASRFATVEWRDGMKFTISCLPTSVIRDVAVSCKVWKFDDATNRRVETLDQDAFVASIAQKIVRSWSGVTLRKLAGHIHLKTDQLEKLTAEQLDAEVDFTLENLVYIMTNVAGLADFIQSATQDVRIFQSLANLQEAKTKN